MEPLATKRARFLLGPRQKPLLKDLKEPLKDAPLRVRRLGLPMAMAMWSREDNGQLSRLVVDWVFVRWGMLDGHHPQGTQAALEALMDLAETTPTLRAAMESEAEQLLQAAKLLSAALGD